MQKLSTLWLLCLISLTSTAQISLVKPFSPCCGIGPFESMGNYFLFNAEGNLWRSDGTTAGTTFVANVQLPRFSWRCRIGNTLYFYMDNARELWKTDGTAAGTQLVKVLGPGFSGPLVAVNGLLVFGFTTAATGTELWRSDGTEAGTHMIVDLLPGAGSGYGYVSPQAAVQNGFFYFLGPSAPTNVPYIDWRATLYRTDGTSAGTTQVLNGGFEPYGMNAQNGRLVYRAYQPTSYTCQGTAYTDYTPVLMKVENDVASILKRPADVRPFGNPGCPLAPIGSTFLNTVQFVNSGSYQYFRTQTETSGGQSPGYNIWRTDGTTNGTIPLTNYPANSTEGPNGNARYMWDAFSRSDYSFSNLAYFPIKSDMSGVELWRSDGTAAGTSLLRDIYPSADSDPVVARTVNGLTYFFATDPNNGYELWRTDGTNAGTQLVQNLNPGTGGQPGSDGIALGHRFYFNGTNGSVHGLYTTLACTEMASQKDGDWNDPSVWSCNRVPMATDPVTVNHAITIPANYSANAQRVVFNSSGLLIYGADGRLHLGQ